MWNDMAVGGGLSALRAGASYFTAKKDAAAKKAWQNYKNSMLMLSGANSQNQITTNENIGRERHAKTAFEIERSEYLTSGQAEVAAAASGTGGRSVNMVMFDVERNASGARAKNNDDLEAQYRQIDNQREAVAFQTATQMDYSPIPNPSASSALMGVGADMYKIYKRQSY